MGVIYITNKTHIWDLKMGGGIGRTAVLREAVLRGPGPRTTVLCGRPLLQARLHNYIGYSTMPPPRPSILVLPKANSEGWRTIAPLL